MFEQLDQPHQAGREVGVSKNHRKKGRLHCARHSTASQQYEVRSDPNYLVERFLPNSKMLGPKEVSLSHWHCQPFMWSKVLHTNGAPPYPLHILDVISVGLPCLRKHEMQLFFPFPNLFRLKRKTPKVQGLW